MTGVFGQRVQRNEDPRLLRGQGCYVDDIDLPGVLHAAFYRSPVARARITSIDTSAAADMPGVVKIYTADNIGRYDRELPLLIPHPCLRPKTARPLARGDVYYVGQPVVMVVATDRYLAEDAASAVVVDFEVLNFTLDLDAALAPGAPLIHEDLGDNIAAELEMVEGDPDKAFAEADHITEIQVIVERSTCAPLECRAITATYDKYKGELLVYDTTQGSIPVRGGLASIFGIDEDKVRVIAPDVGGGFGQKMIHYYSDEILVPLAAMELGVPVKYTEDRTENFTGSNHERLQIHRIRLAATSDGVVTALDDDFLHDTGAFIPYGIAVAQVAASVIGGPYRIPNIRTHFKCVYTPTVTVTPYRGAGRPHACFARERALDQLALDLGLDRWEIRRRNLIGPDEFPYERPGLIFATGTPVSIDSGDYETALNLMAETIDLESFEERQAEARAEGRLLGLGLAYYAECTGPGPYEGAQIRIHPLTGKAHVRTGLTNQGQGHETVFAQITADVLGCAVEDVMVVEGDTGGFDWGVGTFASRAAVVSGSAIHNTALEVRQQMVDLSADLLECSPEDIVMEDGTAYVQGVPDRRISFAQIATMSNPLRYSHGEATDSATQFAETAKSDGPPLAEGGHPGIEATSFFSPVQDTWASGVHAAIVEIDPVTLNLTIHRYVVVHDCGMMINPTIVEGQITGGLAQGMGNAFYERVDYDEAGNFTNANFMEFLMPYATEIPPVEILHIETPSPRNPLGIKGVGEAGTIPVPQTIASAIDDALAHLGTTPIRHVPASPSMLHDKLVEAGHLNAS